MINDIKNFFLLTIFTISFLVVADNPGDIVVSEETEAVSEEVVEDAPVETESESSEEEAPAESDDGVVTLEKVTVTGSRIKRSQVEGATPLIVITKQDMKDNGYRNLTEALQSLPIASAQTQNEALVNTFTPNASELDLRRFGPGRVLVLVNGRRMADYPFPYNNSSNFVNTGTIPAGLIDRIEVATSGSSAIYGSDAVTGVVNIITTTGLEYSEVEAFVGQTDNGGDNILDLTFTTGGFSGNHSWTVGANFYHIDPMYYKDRPGFRSWSDNPIWSDPSDPQYRSTAVFADYLASLQSISGRDQTPRGYGEYGYDAVAANGYTCEQFYPTGFKWDKADYGYTSPPFSYPGSYCVQDYQDDNQTLINERDEYTVMGTYNYNFDNGVVLSARAFYYESESYINSFSRWFRLSNVWTQTPHTTRQDAGFGGLIGTNDFGLYRYTRTLGGQIGPNARRESNYTEDTFDIFVGLSGVYDNGYDWNFGISTTEYNSLYESAPLTTDVYDWITGADRGDTTDISDFYKWRGDLYYNAAFAFGFAPYLNTANTYYSYMNTPAAQNHPCGVDTIVDPIFGTTYSACLAWDRAFAPVANDQIGAFNAPEVTGAETSSTMIDYQVSGELDVQLPGGPMAFAAVIEYHEQDYLLKPDPRRVASDLGTPGVPIFINGSARQGGGDRDRLSVGAEFLLPVTPKLELTAALRSDEYDNESSTVGRRQSAMINFAYRPNDKFLLRGSVSESFRAPDMHYVFAGNSSYFDSVTDHRACFFSGVPSAGQCDDSYTIRGKFRGNPLLDAESGENFSVGFVWDYTEGGSFTLDAFQVILEDAVTNVDVTNLAAREAYCYAVDEGRGDDFESYYNDSDFSSVNCSDVLPNVVRGTTTEEFSNSNLPNITEITTFNTNQTMQEYVGIDTTLRYSFSTESAGDFSFVIYNSNILSRNFKVDDISEEIDYLDTYIYQPRSQQNATALWRFDDWRVSLFLDRTGHMEQYYGEKGDPFIVANLSVGYNFSADFDLRATVSNLEDKMPEKDSAYGFPWFNRGYYSIFGRAVYVSATYRF